VDRSSRLVERNLDQATVRWLYRAGQLDADTATLWLLLLSAQERVVSGTERVPVRLAAHCQALPVVDRCLLRRWRTEQAMLGWRRAAEALETFARPVPREQALVAAGRRLRDCETVDQLVEDYFQIRHLSIDEAHEVQKDVAAAAAHPDDPPERLVEDAAYWRRFGELVRLSVQQGNRQRS
jgi:hypothetical protein